MPVEGRRVVVSVRVRRLLCPVLACPRQTFREQIPGLLERATSAARPGWPTNSAPDETRRVHLSRIFDEDAELCDRARPGYPPELFDDLAEVAGIGPGCRSLR